MRMHPAFWLVLAAWLALMAYVSSLLPGPAGLLVPAGLAVGSAAAAVGAARGLAARLARPAEASFQAQVIARWVEHSGTNDDDSYISCTQGQSHQSQRHGLQGREDYPLRRLRA